MYCRDWEGQGGLSLPETTFTINVLPHSVSDHYGNHYGALAQSPLGQHPDRGLIVADCGEQRHCLAQMRQRGFTFAGGMAQVGQGVVEGGGAVPVVAR